MNIRKAYDLARAVSYDDFMTELRRDIAGVPVTVQSDIEFEVVRKVANVFDNDMKLVYMYSTDSDGNRIPDPETEWSLPTNDDLAELNKLNNK